MGIANVFNLFCGIALFMFGMSLMGDGLKKVAGNRLELLLAKLTNTPLKGIILGTGVTAVIQSSSATSVMAVGFVNSGMMKFRQSIGIILGSLLGTSITGWIIALSEIDGVGGWTALFSTTTITGLIAIVGLLFRSFSKNHSNIGDILLGFVVLMVGISTMSASVAPLKESEAFINLLTMFANPIVGILVGALFTAVLQSASAAVGILQALTATGAIDFATAFPILLGISIGAAVPVLLSALAANTEGKRTSFVYLLTSVLGVVLCGSIFYIANSMMHFEFVNSYMNEFSIALVNTLFRLANVILLCPFIGLIEKMTCLIIPDKPHGESKMLQPITLEERFLPYPSLAISQSRNAIHDMAKAAVESVRLGCGLLTEYSDSNMDLVSQYEQLADKYESSIGAYLMKLSKIELTGEDNAYVFKYLRTLSDFERITDHSMSIAFIAKKDSQENITFSDEANKELNIIKNAVDEMLDMTVEAFVQEKRSIRGKVAALNTVIRTLCNKAELHHVDRLKSGSCSLQQGTSFGELLTDLEQVSVHCYKIVNAILENQQTDSGSKTADAENKANKKSKALEEYNKKYGI
ncbi:MAG: Na/Pi cotransporter family protein [Acutalibacteraceae bacterium]|nr:Na/Pi cotransporter family protein [Acutalibacteraceae bacterium]